MRIAVGFFGIPRSSGICYPSIQKYVVGALPTEAEVTCFYHFYQQDAVINPRSGESHALNVSNYSPFVDNMTGILEQPGECLDRWGFHTLKKYGDAWDDGFSSLSNLVHQLNSLHQVTGLIEAFEPEFVVFARPDLYYHRPLPQYPFSQSNEWQRTVYVPSWQWWNGVNDRFAICGSDSFRPYGFRIEEAMNFCEAGNTLHGERLLKYALSNTQSRIRTISTRATRVRVDGRYQRERFSIMCSTGGQLPIEVLNRVSRMRTLFDRLTTARHENA